MNVQISVILFVCFFVCTKCLHFLMSAIDFVHQMSQHFSVCYKFVHQMSSLFSVHYRFQFLDSVVARKPKGRARAA